jgi:hypothetical protein
MVEVERAIATSASAPDISSTYYFLIYFHGNVMAHHDPYYLTNNLLFQYSGGIVRRVIVATDVTVLDILLAIATKRMSRLAIIAANLGISHEIARKIVPMAVVDLDLK